MESTKRDKIRIRKSICARVMTMTSFIVLCVMLVSTMILRHYMGRLTESIMLDVLQPIAGQAANAVSVNIHLMADRMMGLASDGRLTTQDTREENMEEVLEYARNTYEFYGIGIYDIEGNALVSNGDIYDSFSGAEWYQLLVSTDNLTIADPLIMESHVGIPMGMPIKKDGETWAYMVGVYKYDVLSDVLGAIHIGKSGMALIINEEGKVVGHHQEDIVRQELNIYELDGNVSAHQVFDRMLTRETGSGEGTFNGQESYVAFCPVRGTLWSFAVEVPKADYMEFTNRAAWNTIVGNVLALAVALVFIWGVMTVISRQLKKVIVRMNGLAQGDLKASIEVRKSGDEVEYLSASLKTTIECINGYLEEIKRVLDNISKGNLNVSADGNYQGDFVVVKESLTQIIVSLTRIMKQISETAYQLRETAQDMGNQSQELHQAASSQTMAMEELNSEVETIKTNLGEVTENTKETNCRAEEIAEQIADGSRKMSELMTAMEAINSNAEDINKISKLIEDIARQTNILSLNAAVEAARAGEAGKGFAVVAEEIRSLAAQSEEAAKNTGEIIKTSSELIAQGAALTAETAGALEKISRSSDTVTEITGRLSETVNIQAASLHEITGRIEDVSQITVRNLQCAENTADVSEKLRKESDSLKELLEKFRF